MRHKKKIVVIVVLLLIVWGLWGAHAYSHGSLRFGTARWMFDRQLRHDLRELQDMSQSGLSSGYYFSSYYLNGMISAIEGTDDERLLKKTLLVMDAMEAQAKDFTENGKTYRVWGPFLITADSAAPTPNLHYTFQATVPFARMAAVIHRHPKWKEKYAKTADRYVSFVDSAVIDYWIRYKYENRLPWAILEDYPIWNDNGSNLAINALYLYQATGNEEYKRIAVTLGKAFKDKLAPAKTGWIWDNQTIPIGSDKDNTPGSVGNQAGVPCISHTNREALLMTAFYETGLIFSREDVDRMAHTFTDTVWDGSTESPSFSNYLNGSNKPYRVYKKPGLDGSIYHGWALVGGYLPLAQDALLYTLQAIIIGRTNPSLERNGTSYGGRLSLAGHILRNYAVGDIEQPLQFHWTAATLREGFVFWLKRISKPTSMHGE